MAENIDEFETSLEGMIEKLEEMARKGEFSNEQLEKLGIELKKTKLTAKDFGKAIGTASKGAKDFASGATGATTSFSAVAPMVDALGDAVGGLVSIIPGAEGAIKGLAAVTNFAIKRIEVSYKAFQEVSKAGILSAEGLDGLREQMIESRVPMERLSKMLSKNAADLAYFSGSAVKGGQSFTKVMASMQKGEEMRLRNLGFSLEEIADVVVSSQKMSKRLGFEQQMGADQLRKATNAYGEQLDLIAKLTGKQRSKIEQERDTLMADDQFRAMLNELPNVSLKAKTKMMDSLNAMPAEIGTGIKQIMASGVISGKEAKDLQISGMAQDVLRMRKAWQSGNMSVAEFTRQLQVSAKQHGSTFNAYTALTGKQIGARISELSDLREKTVLSKAEQAELKKLQKLQIEQPKPLTKATNAAAIALQNSQTKIDFMSTSAGFAGTAITQFTKALDYGTDKLMEILGTSQEAIALKESQSTEGKFKNLKNLDPVQLRKLNEDFQADMDAKQKTFKTMAEAGADLTGITATIKGIKDKQDAISSRKGVLATDKDELALVEAKKRKRAMGVNFAQKSGAKTEAQSDVDDPSWWQEDVVGGRSARIENERATGRLRVAKKNNEKAMSELSRLSKISNEKDELTTILDGIHKNKAARVTLQTKLASEKFTASNSKSAQLDQLQQQKDQASLDQAAYTKSANEDNKLSSTEITGIAELAKYLYNIEEQMKRLNNTADGQKAAADSSAKSARLNR